VIVFDQCLVEDFRKPGALAAAGVVLCFAIVGANAAEPPPVKPRLNLTVEVKRDPYHQVLLEMRLKHNYKKPIKFDLNDLPWASGSNMILIAVKAKNGEGLAGYKWCPLAGDITLAPGAELKGDISMETFFDFDKALREDDILVFWSYHLQSDDKVPVEFERVGGWLSIPQDKNQRITIGREEPAAAPASKSKRTKTGK
jgi:hypothetical protein